MRFFLLKLFGLKINLEKKGGGHWSVLLEKDSCILFKYKDRFGNISLVTSWRCTSYNWQMHIPFVISILPFAIVLWMYMLLAMERVKGEGMGCKLTVGSCLSHVSVLHFGGPEHLGELSQLLWWAKSTFDRNRETRKCSLLCRKIINSFLDILSLKWGFDIQVEMSGT